jgi:hypothetical protein
MPRLWKAFKGTQIHTGDPSMTASMVQHYREGKPTSSWTVDKPDDGRTALEAAADNDREVEAVVSDLESTDLFGRSLKPEQVCEFQADDGLIRAHHWIRNGLAKHWVCTSCAEVSKQEPEPLGEIPWIGEISPPESESSSYEPKSVVVDGVGYWCVYDINREIEVWRTKPYLAPGSGSFWTDGRNNSGFVGYGHSYPNIAEAWEEANE